MVSGQLGTSERCIWQLALGIWPLEGIALECRALMADNRESDGRNLIFGLSDDLYRPSAKC